MAEFNIGDKVVRNASVNGAWSIACEENTVNVMAVCTVTKVWGGGDISVAEVIPKGGCLGWSSCYFRLATGLEIHQNSALPAEDHIAENNAHVECLRDLLEVEKQRVATLQDKVAELRDELSKCCGTVADKPKMELVVKQLSDDLVAANDQRDAAVLAAKTLGDEVQHLRQERREYRRGLAEAVGLLTTLEAGVSDVDLLVLSSQLDQIGRMCDEQGNGADAKLAFDAAQVVDMVERTLTKFEDE